MTDLPQIYAEIVARRPELAVPAPICKHTVKLEHGTGGGWRWMHYVTGTGNFVVQHLSDQEVEALIGWHWTKMMPNGYGVFKCVNTDEWTVWDGEASPCGWHLTPLAALAAFWRAQ
jgi:hypothetical protein